MEQEASVQPMAVRGASTPDPNAKLFVGRMPTNVTEDAVRGAFSPYGEIIEVHMIRDRMTQQSRGCCFVKFASLQEAEQALGSMDVIKQIPAFTSSEIKFADGVRTEHKLFVGGLPNDVEEGTIRGLFESYGDIVEIHLMAHKFSAFVKFKTSESADAAIQGVHEQYQFPGCARKVCVRYADSDQERMRKRGGAMMGMMGRGPYGAAPGFGPMQGHPAAGGYMHPGQPQPQQYGMPGQPQPQQYGMAPAPGAQFAAPGVQQPQAAMMGMQQPVMQQQRGPAGANLFVLHLPEYFTDSELYQTFAQFGQILSVRAVSGKGYGFVSFATPESATQAVISMNGFQVGQNRLKVEIKREMMRPY